MKLVYRDGGQHPSFTAKVADVGSPEALVPPTEIALEEKKPAAGRAKPKVEQGRGCGGGQRLAGAPR